MNKLLALGMSLSALLVTPVFAHEDDDPVIVSVTVDQLERRFRDGDDSWALDAEAWVGTDLNKLWLKLDAERSRSDTEALELQLLYGRAFSPYWEWLVGVRQDIDPDPSRTWGVVGVQGLAPYFVETELSLFIGDDGDVAAQLDLEYELLFTQQLILQPELSLKAYRQDDEDSGRGSGLADISFGLRLRYEIRPEFAPYVGWQWSKQYGDTADYSRAAGSPTEQGMAVVGLKIWF